MKSRHIFWFRLILLEALHFDGESHVCKDRFQLSVEQCVIGSRSANDVVSGGVLRQPCSALLPYFLY